MKSFSVICPLRNEKKYLNQIIQLINNITPQPLNVFLVDGNSEDGTAEELKKAFNKHPIVKVLKNPKKIVPYALNTAIPLCDGEIIIRIDAHTIYNSDYFLNILRAFENIDADIIGGPMRIAKGSEFQNTVGWVTSNKFGVGNSSFHFESYEGYTDSVYLGAWKKDIFKTTGLFDTNLVRNQDDEFHYRAKTFGFKIYQSPEIKSYYFPRDSFKSLFSQYFQYGLYKPLVLKKNKTETKLRHLIPSLFVLYLLLLVPLINLVGIWTLIPLLSYIILITSISLAQSRDHFKERILGILIFPTIHISYGSGFIKGLFK